VPKTDAAAGPARDYTGRRENLLKIARTSFSTITMALARRDRLTDIQSRSPTASFACSVSGEGMRGSPMEAAPASRRLSDIRGPPCDHASPDVENERAKRVGSSGLRTRSMRSVVRRLARIGAIRKSYAPYALLVGACPFSAKPVSHFLRTSLAHTSHVGMMVSADGSCAGEARNRTNFGYLSAPVAPDRHALDGACRLRRLPAGTSSSTSATGRADG